MQRLRLVIPAYNDWTSLPGLLRERDDVATGLPSISGVEDGSTHGSEGEGSPDVMGLSKLEAVEIVHLDSNPGHQRAIAIGMAAAEDTFDAVLVMDAESEDSPQAIAKLLTIAGDRQVLSGTLWSILMLLNSRVQRLIVPLADDTCFVGYGEPILNSAKEWLPVFELAPLPHWEKVA